MSNPEEEKPTVDISDAYVADDGDMTVDEEDELRAWLGEVIIEHLEELGVTNEGTREVIVNLSLNVGVSSFAAGRRYQSDSTTFPVEMDKEMLQEWMAFLIGRAQS